LAEQVGKFGSGIRQNQVDDSLVETDSTLLRQALFLSWSRPEESTLATSPFCLLRFALSRFGQRTTPS